MATILLVVQVFLAIALIALVLIQHGKGADAGAAFGSGASATVFGASGSATFLTRLTGFIAAAFFANSLLLSTPLVLDREVISDSVVEMIIPIERSDSALDMPAAPMVNDMLDVPAAPVAPTDNQDDLPPS